MLWKEWTLSIGNSLARDPPLWVGWTWPSASIQLSLLLGRFQTTYGALRDFSRVAELLSIQLTRLRASLEDPTPSASLVSSVREIDQRDGPLQRYKTSMLILIDDLRDQDEKKMFIEIVIVKKAVRYVLLMMETLASLARLCFEDTLHNLPYILPYLCIAVDC